MTYVVVFYDISDNRARQRVADRLLAKGLTRIQRSVFIGRGGLALAKDLARYLARLINAGDSLVIMVVGEESIRTMISIGRGEVNVNASAVRVI